VAIQYRALDCFVGIRLLAMTAFLMIDKCAPGGGAPAYTCPFNLSFVPGVRPVPEL
jgi:hypothetical protein